ncbi:MAG: hypothetical protein ACT4OO_01195, partial [Nitrospiraceae bacterium]
MKKTRNLFVIRVLLWLFIVVSMETRESSAEWYAAGYGGVSGSPSLKDVTMDALGERIANQRFPQATNPTNPDSLGQLVQSFSTSDLSLKSSLFFGGKAGYFFSNE